MPIMGAFELLPVCNLQCKMCYVRKTMADVHKAGGLKDGDWWLDIARSGAECGMLYPLLTGGEPFLHPDFMKILTGMQDLGLQVSINSNATLIDRDVARFLGNHRPTRVNITLYGASEKTYENLCGNGDAYRRVMQAVDLLKEYNVPMKFSTSVTPENVKDMPVLVQYAKDKQIPIQVATYMFPPIRRDADMIGRNDRLSPEDAALARVTSDFLQGNTEWFLAQADRYRQFVPLKEKPWEQGKPYDKGMRCRAGLCSLWVDWQGNFTNCGMYNSVVTNLEGKTFREAWDEVVKATAQVRYNPDCLGCPNEHLCHPCIAMIHNECGAHSGRPEYMCRMHQAMADYYKQFAEEHYAGRKSKMIIAQDPMDTCEL